jgi:hypothetical protein
MVTQGYTATLVAATLAISRSNLYCRKRPRGSRADRQRRTDRRSVRRKTRVCRILQLLSNQKIVAGKSISRIHQPIFASSRIFVTYSKQTIGEVLQLLITAALTTLDGLG